MERHRRRVRPGLLVATVTLGLLAGCDSAGTPAPAPTTSSSSASPTTTPTASSPVPPASSASPSPSASASAAAPSPTAATGPARASTDVVITRSAFDPAHRSITVAGYAAVVQTGGTCVAVVELGSAHATVSGPAEADVSTTTCGSLTVDVSAFPAGTATVTLRYQSPTTAGASAPSHIEVSS